MRYFHLCNTYLLELCVYLREQGGLLVLKEDAQRSAHVQEHHTQQADGRRADRLWWGDSTQVNGTLDKWSGPQ